MFGKNYTSECPAQTFGIACLADSNFPTCCNETCWKYLNTDKLEYKEEAKEMFTQQV